MKVKMLIAGISLVCLMAISCQNDEFDLKDPDVDQFINILKSGNYFETVGYELPDFTINHIGSFFAYLKDTTYINQFPTNPLSSKYTNPKRLNECLFWVIDGIRFGNKYPSLEPCLIDTSAYSVLTGFTRVPGAELITISDLYIDWFEEYRNNSKEALRKKGLLVHTPYRWN